MSEIEVDDGRSGIQVIARAAKVLRALKHESDGLSLGQIADRVHLPRSTVQRIVGALQTERFVIAAGTERGIRLGPELQALAEAGKVDIQALLHAHLVEMSRETNETVDLSVLRGDVLVFLEQVAGTHRLQAVSRVGDVFPLTSTANGKACLALMPDEEVVRRAESEWKRLGRKGDVRRLLDDVRKTRGTGVAFDDDEHTVGISAVGTAFKDWNGRFYAISIPVPTPRLLKGRSEMAEALKRLAARIEVLLRP